MGTGYKGAAAVIVKPADLVPLLDSIDQGRQPSVQAIVLDTTPEEPPVWSPAPTFPHEPLSYYAPNGYQWNPQGNGLTRRAIQPPMLFLPEPQLAQALSVAAENQDRVRASRRLGLAALCSTSITPRDPHRSCPGEKGWPTTSAPTTGWRPQGTTTASNASAT